MTPQEKQEAGIKEARALADKIKRREEERARKL
jgi:hypothetical protein